MKDEILVDVRNVSKKFSTKLKSSLRYGLQDLSASFLGIKQDQSKLRKDEFWAVKDVSFQLKRGECLGLIGHNGAGKSTLLKMLNGLIKPDEGEIIMRGRIGALIELGSGFNPILTGRENVYVNGQILGFTKKEIDKKFEAIIDFAEIGEFIDTPVQNYSSGMKVRLGFAVAAQMEPDVLLIDEVLAVGDVEFRTKCMNRISEILKKSSVIFVSHSMPQIGKISTHGIHLDKGKIKISSMNLGEIIRSYFSSIKDEKSRISGNGKAVIENLNIYSTKLHENGNILSKKGDDIVISFEISIDKSIKNYYATVIFSDLEMKAIAISTSTESVKSIANKKGKMKIEMCTANIFAPGKYTISIYILELIGDNNDKTREYLLSVQNVNSLISYGSNQTSFCPIQLPSSWKLI